MAKGTGQGEKPMLEPALSDLLKPPVLEPIQVLPDDGMLIGVRKPVEFAGANVAGIRAHGERRDATG